MKVYTKQQKRCRRSYDSSMRSFNYTKSGVPNYKKDKMLAKFLKQMHLNRLFRF